MFLKTFFPCLQAFVKKNEEEKIDHDYEYLQLTIRTPGNDIIDLTNEANNLLVSHGTVNKRESQKATKKAKRTIIIDAKHSNGR